MSRVCFIVSYCRLIRRQAMARAATTAYQVGEDLFSMVAWLRVGSCLSKPNLAHKLLLVTL